ncbi:CRISPR-associated DxTHG motif protein [Acinetobacter pittii]|nr:CRISPR-associated DxTHG motif protein [Acinetobacter pittii]
MNKLSTHSINFLAFLFLRSSLFGM